MQDSVRGSVRFADKGPDLKPSLDLPIHPFQGCKETIIHTQFVADCKNNLNGYTVESFGKVHRYTAAWFVFQRRFFKVQRQLSEGIHSGVLRSSSVMVVVDPHLSCHKFESFTLALAPHAIYNRVTVIDLGLGGFSFFSLGDLGDASPSERRRPLSTRFHQVEQ